MKRTTLATLFVLTALGVSPSAEALSTRKKSSNSISLFSKRLTITLPRTARTPRKITSTTYQVQPKSPEQKFVVYVIQENLRRDEIKKSNKELVPFIKRLLEGLGYEVIQLKNAGDTFTADFRSYATVPWQKVGTSPVRGTARFVRTKDNKLLGSILMCEPSQWTDTAISTYKRAVSGIAVKK